MDARAMLRLAADLNLFAGRAARLRNEAANYRALGKSALADLLDIEADESEASARKALAKAGDPEIFLQITSSLPAVQIWPTNAQA